ncbi:MAG: hypothetical protein Q8908_10225 [Bacteroidota bacterium]|nr:hypothetical protein [Bacteroidota bacterium]
MKKIIFLVLIAFLAIGSYAQKKMASIEGAWKMVFTPNYFDPNAVLEGKVPGSQIKMWSKEIFLFVGHFEMDTTKQESFGGGTYKLNGKRYEENITYHFMKPLIGQNMKMLLEIRHDTLIQRWPVDENWKLVKGYYTEQYVRLKKKC